ncbi:delta(24)-sterol reductase-like [Folsomia candida]|uniref:delta(24)-sterol reductase-like n=1 Tax=Folsomia candida TaxID=158441 RepID=UPI001604E601|nr:delta(24)-sterol reductase-like [Folsomia candida]
MVLSTGKVVNCSEDENSDLFYSLPGSYGTTGFLTAAKFRLMKAEKYVKLSYIPVNSLDEATERITKESLKTPGHDFIEGIMYSLDKGVIMVGSLTSKAEPGKVNSVARWYKKSFYKHVESFLSCSQSAPKVEYIPLRHYYHRHTYCIFWVTRFCIPYMEVAPLRWMLGWVAPCEMNWYKLIPLFLRRLFEENLLIQDHVVPIEKMKMAMKYLHDKVELERSVCKYISKPGRILSNV